MNILIAECNMVEKRCIHSLLIWRVEDSFSKDRLTNLSEKGKYILIRTCTVDL